MGRIIVSLLLLSIYSSALADEVVVLGNGKRAILKDDGTWSYQVSSEQRAAEAYQNIRSSESKPGMAAEMYQNVNFNEIKSDIDSLDGKKVKVQSLAEMYNFILMLKQDKADATSVSVNINRLSKEIRSQLREECDSGCQVTVYGRVGDVMGTEKGIVADKVEW